MAFIEHFRRDLRTRKSIGKLDLRLFGPIYQWGVIFFQSILFQTSEHVIYRNDVEHHCNHTHQQVAVDTQQQLIEAARFGHMQREAEGCEDPGSTYTVSQ